MLANAWKGKGPVQDGIAGYGKLGLKRASVAEFRKRAGMLMLAGLMVSIVLTNVKGAQTAGEIMLSSLTAASQTFTALMNYHGIFLELSSLPGFNKSAFSGALHIGHSFTSSAGKAGAAGAVIGGVATWALFFAAWGKGALAANSVEFNNLLAGAIASTLVIVLTFFLSLSVVGAIILAVFGIFDLITLIICKAGAKKACSLGITEAITKLITEWIYTGSVMIDTKADPAITNIDDAQLHLTQPTRGMVVGNSARFTVDLYSYIRHAAPEPGIIYHYSNFFTPADLRSTTVRYTLEATARKLPTDLNQTDWPSVAPYSWVQVDVPSPVVGWLVPTTKSKDLYHGARNDQLTSGLYPFSRAQINESFPLYLNTGMALPRYDCWFQICTHKAAKSAVSTDLGKQFILDILPATLDDFVGWSQLGPQIDPDGDGLVAAVDPDQTKWDSDGDGLPDGVEYEYGSKRGYGFNPHKADADNDGLNDAAETRYGTDPRKADSDDFLPDPADTNAGDTTGDLLGWSLEVCVDNGNPPTPPPTPTATATPEPAPVNGMPVAPPPTATESTPVAISTVCVLTADDYEEDDTSASAASFDLANQNNGVRTFDSLIDSDWITFTAFANLRYTFAVNLMSGNDGVTLALYDVDGLTHLVSAENQVSFTPTADGLYYLRAKSAAGMVSPCNVSYSIGVSVINPNATPVPTAEGTPVRNRYRNSVSSCGVRPAVNRYCSTPP